MISSWTWYICTYIHIACQGKVMVMVAGGSQEKRFCSEHLSVSFPFAYLFHLQDKKMMLVCPGFLFPENTTFYKDLSQKWWAKTDGLMLRCEVFVFYCHCLSLWLFNLPVDITATHLHNSISLSPWDQNLCFQDPFLKVGWRRSGGERISTGVTMSAYLHSMWTAGKRGISQHVSWGSFPLSASYLFTYTYL